MTTIDDTVGARAIKWSYMDHWRSNEPSGPRDQWHNRDTMDRFLKQVSAVGFNAIDVFDFRMLWIQSTYGSVANYQEFVRERGLERIVNIFHGVDYDPRDYAPHVRDTHPNILEDFRRTMDAWSGITLDNVIVMPATRYYDMEPITEDKLKVSAELWGKVGEITQEWGVQLTCHHEFYCGIQTRADLDVFYANADPQYVHLFLDTAQHCIANVDPVDLFDTYHDRVTGFHFKDTRNHDTNDDRRLRPESELMAKTTDKWFYEMGTAEGLVDFESMMRRVRDHGYSGWISVEHDKANKQGGDYAESTAISRWYAKNVLERIYNEDAK